MAVNQRRSFNFVEECELSTLVSRWFSLFLVTVHTTALARPAGAASSCGLSPLCCGVYHRHPLQPVPHRGQLISPDTWKFAVATRYYAFSYYFDNECIQRQLESGLNGGGLFLPVKYASLNAVYESPKCIVLGWGNFLSPVWWWRLIHCTPRKTQSIILMPFMSRAK